VDCDFTDGFTGKKINRITKEDDVLFKHSKAKYA